MQKFQNKSTNTRNADRAQEKHLATGGNLILLPTIERIRRTTVRQKQAKRITLVFEETKNISLNWKTKVY